MCRKWARLGVLLLFPAMKTTASHTSPRCDECHRLEGEYQLAVEEIYSVVHGTFRNLAEKLTRLYEWQDVRDRAV
jgi:hypothetical protein